MGIQTTFFSFLSCTLLAELAAICKDYNNRIFILEGEKWDLERSTKVKHLEVNGTRSRVARLWLLVDGVWREMCETTYYRESQKVLKSSKKSRALYYKVVDSSRTFGSPCRSEETGFQFFPVG